MVEGRGRGGGSEVGRSEETGLRDEIGGLRRETGVGLGRLGKEGDIGLTYKIL